MKSDAAIQKEILAYLAVNSKAQDTLEGIREWWLLQPRGEQAVTVIEAALAKLVSAGKLQTKTGPDGRMHYLLGRPALISKRIERVGRRREQNSHEGPKRPRAAA